jgi:DNA-directed RNA polymerase specialized sigma24 family protein
VRPRHSDADLVDLARSGSAPAFASLIHRHRDVVQRTALRSTHPEQAAESIMRSGMARLRRADVRPEDLRTWLTVLAEQQVLSDPGHPHVERMLREAHGR